MAYKNKAEQEKEFTAQIKGKVVGHCKSYENGNWYYCFSLADGTQRFWTNPSGGTLKELGATN